jgi:hypothetical protein
MNLRILFLLLALVLVWTGHAVDRPESSSASITLHHHQGNSAAGVTHQTAESEGDSSPAGQTTQAAEEAVLDLVGLLPAGSDTPSSSLLMSRPAPYANQAWIAPYLDGPKRPPRATYLLA